MDNSPLGKLSAEIRNTISAMVLQHEFVKVNITGKESDDLLSYTQDTEEDNKHPLALAHTCKQARSECTKMYYAINWFVMASGPVTHRQFCEFFNRFTRSGELKLGKAFTMQFVHHLDDEKLVASLREAILKIPEQKSDGLDQISSVTLRCTILEDETALTFGRDGFAGSIFHQMNALCGKMGSKTSFNPSRVDKHGSKCLIRAARTLACLLECLGKMSDDYSSQDVSDAILAKLNEPAARAVFANMQISVESFIATQLQVEDTPCAEEGCLLPED